MRSKSFPNPCIRNNIEETQFAMEQDVNLSSSIINFSSSSTNFCLMAKSSSNDDNDNNNEEEEDNDEVLHDKGIMVLKTISKNKNACDNLYEIMSTLVERGDAIKALETSLEGRQRTSQRRTERGHDALTTTREGHNNNINNKT